MLFVLKSPALGKTGQRLALCGRDELRVEGEHFETPRDDVFNRSAGSVIARAKFKVLKIVAGFVESPAMVDGFGGQERSPKKLFHNVAVLKHLTSKFAGASGDTHDNVSTLNPPRQIPGVKSFLGLGALPIGLAFDVAKLLRPVIDGAPRAFVPLHRVGFAALQTNECALGFGVSATPGGRTWNGAVNRVFAVFLPVFRQVGGLVGKRLPAHSATKGCLLYLRSRPPVDGFMGYLARAGAKPAGQFAGACDVEYVAALLARQISVGCLAVCFNTSLAAKALMTLGGTYGEGVAAKFACFLDWHRNLSLGWHLRDYPAGIRL